MEKEKEHYLNVTLNNSEPVEEETVHISIVGILSNFKRFFALWLSFTIMLSIVAMVVSVVVNRDVYKTTTALVSFSYSGIEQGLDPAGNKFDANTLKSPIIIERALNELGYDNSKLEAVRRSMTIDAIVPKSTNDKISAYKAIVANGGNTALTATEKLLDISYNATQFKVEFDYSSLDIKDADAAIFLNTLLDCYSKYMFEKYGYDAAMGNAITAIDYRDYDYAEAVDVFDDTVSQLQSYIGKVSSSSSVNFRSIETGYTFADLSKMMNILRDKDLDMVDSYINVYCVTKDKDFLLTYYKHRVESLQRTESIYREELESIKESIKEYEKDKVVIFANGTDSVNTEATEVSEQYDHLYNLRIDKQNSLSSTIQRINYYNSRIEKLNNAKLASADKIEKVEKDLEKINEKVTDLIDVVNATADEYYETVEYSKMFNILVPASASTMSSVKGAIKDGIKPTVLIDALVFMIYCAVSVMLSIITEYKKNKKDKIQTSDVCISEN